MCEQKGDSMMVILFFYIRGRVFTKDRGGSFFGALMG